MASLLAARILYWILPNVFGSWNAQLIDQSFLLRSSLEPFRPAYDSTIVHVDLTDESLRQLQNFYLDRTSFAQVVSNLGAMGVAAQAWDFIFAARTQEPMDSALISATREAGNVYYGIAFRLSAHDGLSSTVTKEDRDYLQETRWNIVVDGDPSGIPAGTDPTITFTGLARAARGLGYLSTTFDEDGVFRRLPLLVRLGDGFYPSLALRVTCDYLHVSPERIVLRPGESLTLSGARWPGGEERDLVIPLDEEGNMVVNYIGDWGRMKHYDFADILFASYDRFELDMFAEELHGTIAVVAEVTTGAADVGPVPTDNNFPLSGLHANAIHTILTGSFLHETSGAVMLLIELAMMGILFWLSIRLTSVQISVGTAALLILYLIIAVLLFLNSGIILNVLRPSMALVIGFLSIMAYLYVSEQKQKEVLRRSFEAYFPPTVVRKIVNHPEMITAGGQKKELTVLFSDIKSFTTHSASLTPDQIQKLLNEYFDSMVDIVFRHGGTVDKFIGDGLMVFFGDPEPQDDHALRCVRAAVEMQREVRRLRLKWEQEGRMSLQIRIGVNTGQVVVGNMGSARRLSYTVLGAPVNLAQRLESNAPVGGILISERTNELIQRSIPTRSLGQIQVKGLNELIDVYEVILDEEIRPQASST